MPVGNPPEMLPPIVMSAPTQVPVAGVSILLAAANANRRFIAICNNGAQRVSLAFGVAAVLDSGITLQPNGGIVILSNDDRSTQAINGISTVVGTLVGVQEGVT